MRSSIWLYRGWCVSGSNAISVCDSDSRTNCSSYPGTYCCTYCISNEGRRCSIVRCECLYSVPSSTECVLLRLH